MSAYKQVKLGPELMSNSREAWLGYYVFIALALISLGGGYLWLRSSGFVGADRTLALLALLVIFLVCLGIAIMCHLMGHLIDRVDALHEKLNRNDEMNSVG